MPAFINIALKIQQHVFTLRKQFAITAKKMIDVYGRIDAIPHIPSHFVRVGSLLIPATRIVSISILTKI